MNLKTLKQEHIEEIVELSINEYKDECDKLTDLPQNNFRDLLYNKINRLIINNIGLIALDNKNNIIGYLTGYSTINELFGNCKGFFSPLYGHGTIRGNRFQINKELYNELAKLLIDENIYSHAISIYSHSNEAIHSYFENGFGMRCCDAILYLENYNSKIIDIRNGFKIQEILHEDLPMLLNLKNNLLDHMRKSPTFIPSSSLKISNFIDLSKQRKSRFFTISRKEKIIGYLEIKNNGETFISEDKSTVNICGAYIKPEFRGQGLYSSLLRFVLDKIKKENYLRCGVDFETINPVANNFWKRNFKPYSYSLTRRIDERINNQGIAI